MTQIRILTINTAKGDFDYQHRIQWLAHELKRLRPDIVLVQESLATVEGSEIRFDTAQALADALDIDHVSYAPVRRKMRSIDSMDHDTYSGLAILSRFPILESAIVPLPASPDDGERINLLAELAVGSMRLLVDSLHLTYLHGTGTHEMPRAEIDATLCHPWFQRIHATRGIGGNLNTHFNRLPALVEVHHGLDIQDIWTIGDGAGSRATIPVSRPPTHERAKCIDYLLSIVTEDPVHWHQTFVETSVVLGDQDSEGHFPNDHRGVLTTLILDQSEGFAT